MFLADYALYPFKLCLTRQGGIVRAALKKCVCTQAVNLQLPPVSMDDTAHMNTQPQEPHSGKVHPDPEAPPAPSCEPAHAEKAAEEPLQSASCCMVLAFFKAFVRKMSGGLGKPPPVPPPVDWFLASIGSLCVSSLQYACTEDAELPCTVPPSFVTHWCLVSIDIYWLVVRMFLHALFVERGSATKHHFCSLLQLGQTGLCYVSP